MSRAAIYLAAVACIAYAVATYVGVQLIGAVSHAIHISAGIVS